MSKKIKPTKDPFIKYYILWPIQDLGEELVSAIKWGWRKLTGAWWCDHCETYHGRRVHKFIYHPNLTEKITNTIVGKPIEDSNVCSLGRDAKLDPGNVEAAAKGLEVMAKQTVQAAKAISDARNNPTNFVKGPS